VDQGDSLLALYDEALPHVYGYLLRRCHHPATAEDLTAETFLAAVHAVRWAKVDEPSVPWLLRVARNKLVDHWRRQAREDRRNEALDPEPLATDDWTDELDHGQAVATLRTLGAHHQAALALRYFDDLSVPEVAEALGRSVHATEALLVRARIAFRKAYTHAD
jgi:RNA polymerase sigma-70 factor (ECF subfamily)